MYSARIITTRCSASVWRGLGQNSSRNTASILNQVGRRAFQTEARNGWRTWDAVQKAPGITGKEKEMPSFLLTVCVVVLSVFNRFVHILQIH